MAARYIDQVARNAITESGHRLGVFGCSSWADTGVAERAGLTVAQIHKPLGSPDDSVEWRDETTMSPLAIYVLKN